MNPPGRRPQGSRVARSQPNAAAADTTAAAAASPGQTGHRGNKAYLPSKPCATCGRTMVWRKAWARNWAEVKHCSDACRRQRKASHHG